MELKRSIRCPQCGWLQVDAQDKRVQHFIAD